MNRHRHSSFNLPEFPDPLLEAMVNSYIASAQISSQRRMRSALSTLRAPGRDGSPLLNSTITEAEASSYRIFSVEPPGAFVTQRTFIYYIYHSAMEEHKKAKFQDLNFVIIGPSGDPVHAQHFCNISDKMASFNFRPLLPGFYKISANFENGFHISGSPVYVPVSRNYMGKMIKPIVSVDLGLLDQMFPDERKRIVRRPWGLACNTKTEQIFVADCEHHEILVYSPDGDLNFSFGKSSGIRPGGLAYDSVGDRVIIADKDNHRIQTFTPQGIFLSSFGCKGTEPGAFYHPWTVAVSRDGNYIAVYDSGNHRIQLFNSDCKFVRLFQFCNRLTCTSYKSLLDYPQGIAFSIEGDFLYVSDFNQNTVFQLDIAFVILTKFADGFNWPSGMVVDDVGNLLVCNKFDNSIKIYSSDGMVLDTRRELGTVCKPYSLDQPTNIVKMSSGYLAVLDSNHRLTII